MRWSISAAVTGRPKRVALHGMHAGGAQEQMLIGSLDAFRRHFHAETAAEADDGMNDGRGIGGLLDRAHETRIDLELVEWKTRR